MNTTIPSANDITNREEARDYYAATLAGVRTITCYGKRVSIVFEADATHLFSDGPPKDLSQEEQRAWVAAIPPELRVERRLPKGRTEVRRFSLERAHLMGHVLPAISRFTVSVPGTGRDGHEKRMLHGPALPDGRYMRVLLRPGPGDAFTCVSAYTVNVNVWRTMVAAKRAKFPP